MQAGCTCWLLQEHARTADGDDAAMRAAVEGAAVQCCRVASGVWCRTRLGPSAPVSRGYRIACDSQTQGSVQKRRSGRGVHRTPGTRPNERRLTEQTSP